MFKSFRQEANDLDLIDAEEFTLLKDNEEIYFRLGKTKTKKYIVIQAQYEYNNNSSDFFQTLLTINNLQQKSHYFGTASTIDDCFMFLKILFQDKTIYVKDIIKNNILKLAHVYEGKSVDINLPYKKNENNYFIRKALTTVNNHLNLNKKNELKIEEENDIINNENNQKEEKKDIIKKYNSQTIEIKENEEKNEFNEINLKREETNNINEIDDIKDNIIKDNIDNDNINNDINNDINTANEEIYKDKEDDKDINNEKDNNIIKENNDKDNNNKINDENQNINSEEKDNKDNNNEINDENKNMIIEEKNNSNNDNNYNDKKNNEKKDNGNNEIMNENININKEIEDKNDKKEIKDVEEINKKEENKKNENDISNADVKEKKIHEDKKNNNNKKINDNNMNVDKLLERIKILEEENNHLKSENKQLKEQISQMNYNEEKLKKSEKEKESLKIELQKLKNSLNSGNSDEKKQNKNTSNFPQRMQTMPFVSKIDLYQPKKDMKENSDKSEKNTNHINKIKINNEQKIENKNHNKIKIESKPPINLKVHKTVTQSSFIRYSIDNCFAAFTSLNDELLLVYATKFKSLECFDLVKQKYQKTILNAHNGTIITIRHYCPPKINKDLILSGSNGDYCAKLWDIESWTCIFNLNKIYQKGNMYSICILFDEYQKESLLITSSDSDFIKIWGINGNFIKNINKTNSNEVYLVDTYYDNKEYKYYLITGEMKCAKSYDLNTHKIFRVYSDNNSYTEHVSAFVHTQPGKAGVTLLVECEFYGSIRIWNFHNGIMIKKMDICRRIPLVSLCLWNENYLLASCVDNTIKLIDFKNYILIKSFSGHNNEVCTIKKIIHPTYGECLISQGMANEQIKMWING